jgi:flavin reductase ActVB
MRIAFTNAMAQFVSGVCVVTAQAPVGGPAGLLATSVCSYSADPPALLVCVGREGLACTAISAAHSFAVQLLRAGREDVARRFAMPGAERFASIPWRWDAGVPALPQDLIVAYLRCATTAVMPHGDHVVVIGEVKRTITSSGAAPLIYMRRRMDWSLLPNRSLEAGETSSRSVAQAPRGPAGEHTLESG